MSTPRVIIVGAGIGGVSCAIALKTQLGFQNFKIIEKGSDVGGTWRDNTYPGCGSDIYIHYYSHSSYPNPNWSSTHPPQPEIWAYWRKLTDQQGLYPHINFNTVVQSATWDVERQLWRVVMTHKGKEEVMEAEVLISAIGVLEQPHIPPALQAGLQKFDGKWWHSARWDHSVNLGGQRVGVIGNGASATQFVPIISKDPTTQITQFYRTPSWYVERHRPLYSSTTQWIFANIPLIQKLYRTYRISLSEMAYFLVFGSTFFNNIAKKKMRNYMIKTAPKEYHEQLIPDYPPGCKRLVVDSNYLPALHRPNLKLCFEGVAEIREGGVVTKSGSTTPFDILIIATGFLSTSHFPIRVEGLGGKTLTEYYDEQKGPTAYMGTTVPGFPNFWTIGGPNTITGHGSVIFTEEVQINYAMELLKPILAHKITSLTPKSLATDKYNDILQYRLGASIYTSCISWYRSGPTGEGKIWSQFPGPIVLFWWWLRFGPFWGDYDVVGRKGEVMKWERERRRRRFGKAVLGVLVLVGLAGGIRGRENVRMSLRQVRGQMRTLWMVSKAMLSS